MKIAHITPVYPPYAGGIGNVAADYATDLALAGEETHVFTPDYDGSTSSEESAVKVHRLKTRIKSGKGAVLWQLFRRLKSFDLIHLHYPFYGTALIAAWAAKWWNIPLVVTYHMKTKGTGWRGIFFSLYRQTIEPLVLDSAEKILVSSVEYAEACQLPYKNIVELPFGVDARRFSPAPADSVRNNYQIHPESLVFIFVGGLDAAHYFKGADILLEALSKLPTERKWDLILVGDGERKEILIQSAQESNLTNRVHFAGRVSPEALPDFYRAAQVHVLPSIDRSEAFGLVTLEAAASGLASVVSDLPGVRALVAPEETGYWVEPKNLQALHQTLTQCLQEPEKVGEMGRAARRRIEEHYSREVCLRKLRQIYAGCL